MVRRPPRADEESHGRAAVPNPYNDAAGGAAHHAEITSSNRLFDKAKRCAYCALSLYFLQRFMDFFPTILHSPQIRHEWFKVGLAATIAILSIKAYVELFQGLIRKRKVNYDNFRQSTHAAIALILLSTVAFHVALWPHYHWNTPVVLGVAFFGVILQFLIIVPPWVANIVSFVGLTFFLQEYK